MDLPETLTQDDLELLALVREGSSDLLADAVGLERLKARGLIRICTIESAKTGEALSAPFPFPTADGLEALGLKVERVGRFARAS